MSIIVLHRTHVRKRIDRRRRSQPGVTPRGHDGRVQIERLRAVAWSALLLALAAGAAEVGWAYRAATAGGLPEMRFATWMRPFVDGPSPPGLQLTLAAVVLVAVVPSTARFARLRRAAAGTTAVVAVANVVLGLGYVAASQRWVAPPGAALTRPSLALILLDEVPSWALAVVTLLLAATTLPRLLAPDDDQRPAPGELDDAAFRPPLELEAEEAGDGVDAATPSWWSGPASIR
jgi:hypothetical protein